MIESAGGAKTAPPSRGRPGRGLWGFCNDAVRAINVFTGVLAGILIICSAGVITNEVIWRYYLRRPHTWNLELNIFLLIGATFLAANYTQMKRAHVGTEVLQAFMPARWNRWRILAGDILSLLLCAFMAVKVLQYDWQAWVKNWRTDSTWAPPLWIPYTLIGVGLVLISVEYVLQITAEITGSAPQCGPDEPG
ncbi:MAG: TRAP transporter small permease [Acetobacteraceae bacterium]